MKNSIIALLSVLLISCASTKDEVIWRGPAETKYLVWPEPTYLITKNPNTGRYVAYTTYTARNGDKIEAVVGMDYRSAQSALKAAVASVKLNYDK